MKAPRSETKPPRTDKRRARLPRRVRRAGVSALAFAIAVALGACGSTSDNPRAQDDSPATSAQALLVTNNDACCQALPDLDNPSVRDAFVTNFADGYFIDP